MQLVHSALKLKIENTSVIQEQTQISDMKDKRMQQLLLEGNEDDGVENNLTNTAKEDSGEEPVATPSTLDFDDGFNYDDFVDDYEIDYDNPNYKYDNDKGDVDIDGNADGNVDGNVDGNGGTMEGSETEGHRKYRHEESKSKSDLQSHPPQEPKDSKEAPQLLTEAEAETTAAATSAATATATEPPLNLYDETMEMWEISTIMFFLSKMRNWARDNELFNDSSYYSTRTKDSKKKPSPKSKSSSKAAASAAASRRKQQKETTKKRHRILGRKIKVDDILHTMVECYDCLKEREGTLQPDGTPRVDLHIHVMESIRKRTNHEDDFVIVNFDDSREDEEIVSAIIVDKQRKRVVVAFRGSQSKNDWVVNLSCVETYEENPIHLMKNRMKKNKKQQQKHQTVQPINPTRGSETPKTGNMQKMIQNQPRKILLHTGFYHSIFGDKSRYGKDTKYEYIIKKTLQVLKEHPGYKLVVTGLSLGGALCQMFSLYAAAETDPLITKPVTCYSFASPKVGALTYRRAVQWLEEFGHLRLMRVLNEHDPVSLYPRDPFSMCFFTGLTTLMLMIKQGRFYRKAGIEVKFLNGGGVVFTHPKVPRRKVNWNAFHFVLFGYDMERQWERQTNCCGCISDAMTPDDGPSYREQHGYPFYYLQIRQRMDELRKYTLEDLYSASSSGDSDVVEPIFS